MGTPYDPDEVNPVMVKVWNDLYGPDAAGPETVRYQPGQPVKPARARAGFAPKQFVTEDEAKAAVPWAKGMTREQVIHGSEGWRPSNKMSAEILETSLKGGPGNAQALIDWYEAGADGAIDWGSPGDFAACVAIAGKYIDNPEGFCNLRHQAATGGPPGHAPGEKD